MSQFDNLRNMIALGMEGDNNYIPIGLPRLGKYANIREKILTLIFSTTGAGKSAMIDTIIINACRSHMNSPGLYMRPDFQLFSMERAKELRIAKWISQLIFIEQGEIIEIPKMMGWWDEKITKEELSLIDSYKPFMDQMLNDYIDVHGGAKSPNEIWKIMKDHLEKKGEYGEETIKGKTYKKYTKLDPREICIPVIDHGNLTKKTKELSSKKEAIDKLVEMLQGFRDLESCAPIWVSQVNRSISSVTRSKDGEFELVVEDVKESGDIVDASDIAISIFDPVKYNQSSKTGYTPTDFIDQSNGNKYFRSAQIHKSSYGADDIRIPLAFNGFCGQFKELPKRKDLDDSQYNDLINSVITKNYFL